MRRTIVGATPLTASRTGSARFGHQNRVEGSFQFLLRQDLFLAAEFANSLTGPHTFLRDLGRAIVADLGREARYHRHRKLDQLFTTRLVCFDSSKAFVAKHIDDVGKEPDRFEK